MAAKPRHESFIGSVALVCGPAVAFKLIEAFSGERIYFARNPTADQEVSKVIGRDMAEKIAREIGDEEQSIPQRHTALSAIARDARREQMRGLLAEGMSQRKMARRLRCGIRTVERDVAWLRAQERQP